MASSSFLTLAKPFNLSSPSSSPFLKPSTPSSFHRFPGLRKNALKISAGAQKLEPTKVVPQDDKSLDTPRIVFPQADRVLIRLEELPQKSAGGVLLPVSAVKFERYLMGEVLSVGAEVGGLEPGKKVLFSDISAYEVDMGTDAKHCFCRADDLLAVVE